MKLFVHNLCPLWIMEGESGIWRAKPKLEIVPNECQLTVNPSIDVKLTMTLEQILHLMENRNPKNMNGPGNKIVAFLYSPSNWMIRCEFEQIKKYFKIWRQQVSKEKKEHLSSQNSFLLLHHTPWPYILCSTLIGTHITVLVPCDLCFVYNVWAKATGGCPNE